MGRYRQNYFDTASRRRGRGSMRTLMYAGALVIPPCSAVGALMSHESGILATIALVSVSVWWFFFGAYGLMFGRDLFTDIAPFVVIPYAALKFLARIARGVAFAIRWVLMLLSGGGGPEDADFIPQSWSTAMMNPRFRKKLSDGWTAAIGRNETGVVYINFKDDLHYLLTGKSGNGKTTIAYSIILSLISSIANFGRWEFVLHDPKGAMGRYRLLTKAFPNKFRWYEDFDDIYDSMVRQIEEVKRRGHMIGQADTDTFEIDGLGLPQRLIVIDDHHLIRSRHTKDEGTGVVRKGRDYMDMLTQLVSTGRQAGFHVVLITTYARGDHVDPIYRLNFTPITGWLPRGSAERTIGVAGAHRLKKHQFLYLPDPSLRPIYFENYNVEPADIKIQAAKLLVNPETPEEIAVQVYAQERGCGWRRLLTEGQDAARLLVDNGTFSELPFPFTEKDVRREGDKPFYSSSAQTWAREFGTRLEVAGIAGPTRPGTYREFVLEDAASAIASWRAYKPQEKFVGGDV